MRQLSTIFVLLCCYLSSWGQMKWSQTYQNYFDQYKDIAIQEMLKWKIPASITLAQGVFESGAGRSTLAVSANNHFGIKCHDWTGKRTYKDDDEQGECFRVYDNALQSYEDHSRFLAEKPRYRSLFSLNITDYKGWARGLKAAGYATNPLYADKLIQIIELYQLYKYDQATSYDKFMARHNSMDKPSQGGTLHRIYIYNGNYYLRARQGDSFKSIGQEVGISYRKLARYNERNKKDQLQEGEVIYLKKKRSKAEKSFKNRPHIVKAGESLYSISQMYGVRLKSIYKKNNLSPDYQLRVGDRIRVY